jgi:hypothetical protein
VAPGSAAEEERAGPEESVEGEAALEAPVEEAALPEPAAPQESAARREPAAPESEAARAHESTVNGPRRATVR